MTPKFNPSRIPTMGKRLWGIEMRSPEISRITIQNLNETNFGNSLLLENITIVRPHDNLQTER